MLKNNVYLTSKGLEEIKQELIELKNVKKAESIDNRIIF